MGMIPSVGVPIEADVGPSTVIDGGVGPTTIRNMVLICGWSDF